jgi:N-acetylmuramoyl-L-alanine amidase
MIVGVTRLHRWLTGLLLAGATVTVPGAGAQTATPSAPALAVQPSPARRSWTVLSSSGSQPLPLTVVNGRDYVTGADLTGLFGVVLREDRAGGLVLTLGSRTIVVSLTQGLASVEGRVVSLPAPPVRQGGTWLLPVDIIERALAPGASPRIDVRPRASLIVLGTLTVPAVTVRSEPLTNGTRLNVVATPAVAQTVVNENGRLLLRFAADALDADIAGIGSSQVLTGARLVPPSTIEIGLGAAFASYRASEQREGGQLRLTLDLLATSAAAPSETTATAPAAEALPSAPQELPPLLPESTGVRTIVIDPGHGGSEQGARGPSGTLEKNVALAVARQLKAAIEARLGLRVLLTRGGDETVALDARAAFANNNKADLFISLHANASVRSSVAGAEVFYVTLGEYGNSARVASAAEPGALLPTLGGGERVVDLILWEMAQAQHLNASARLARLMEGEMRQRLPMSPRAIQQAPFRVLVGANMPAVLVEMGFITNPTEEKRLNTPEYQSQIVNALLSAVVQFKATSERIGAPSPVLSPAQEPR